MATSNTPEDFTKCSICLSSFTQPRMLNCLHTFCLPCLEKLVEEKEENTNIKCPLCRSEFMLPMAGLSGLESPAFFLKESSDSRKEVIPLTVCQVCDSSRVVFVKCIECNEYLCKDCQKCHGKFKATKDHELEYLQTRVKDFDKSVNVQCNEHSKDRILFCKPCNNSVCTECQKSCHKSHDVISLFDAASKKRNTLIAGIRGLKSKILPAIEKTLDEAKVEENNFYKQCSRIKTEIRDHATGLKEIFARQVDLAMNANIEDIEKLKNTEIKKIDAFIDRLETDKLSYASLLHTSESIVIGCTDNQIVKESPKLQLRLNEMTKYEGPNLELNQIEYTSGEISEDDIMRIVGNLQLIPKTTLTTSFRQMPIPDLRLVKTFKKVKSFDTGDEISSVVGGLDSNAWILHNNQVSLYSNEGKSIKRYVCDSASHLLKSQDGTIYVWGVNSATKLGDNHNSKADFFKLPFESFDDVIVGCFLSNNNLVVYNPDDKTLYEVNSAGVIQQKIINERLSESLHRQPLNMIETSDNNWIIVQTNSVITLRPDGIVQNILSRKSESLPSICSDHYGNVFVTSCKAEFWGYSFEILLRSANDFQYSSVQHMGKSENRRAKHLTIDGHGNLWCTDGGKQISIYSYT